MIAWGPVVYVRVMLSTGDIYTFRETSSYTFNVKYSAKKDDPSTASVTISNVPDDLSSRKALIQVVEIIAGFSDSFGTIFKGVPTKKGVTETQDGRDYTLAMDLNISSNSIRDLQNIDIPANTAVKIAINQLCIQNNYTLKDFPSSIQTNLPQGFQATGSFLDILSRLCDIIKCTPSIDASTISIISIDAAKQGSAYKVSTATNSVLSFSEGYDKKTGGYIDVDIPLVYDIRIGSEIAVEIEVRGSTKKYAGFITSVEHSGGSDDYPTTKVRLNV